MTGEGQDQRRRPSRLRDGLGSLAGWLRPSGRRARTTVADALARADESADRRRHSEELQLASLDALEQGIAQFDLSGDVLLINRAGEEILGFTAEELTERFWSGQWITYREDGTELPPEERPLRVVIEGGSVEGAVIGWRDSTGGMKLLRVSVRPLFDDAGNVASAVVAFADITADRAVELAAIEANRALAAAEAELRRSFEQSAVPTVHLGPHGEFRRVNAAFVRLVGRPETELLETYYLALIHAPDRDEVLRHGQAMLDGAVDSEVIESRLLRGDGSIIWTRMTITAVRSPEGTLTHVVAQLEDITEAREAQAALRSSEARFAALVERSTDIICVLDAGGRLTYASPAGERVLGYAPGSRVGVNFQDLVHPDDRTSVASTFADLLEHHGAVRVVEVRLADHRGQWRNVEVVATNRLHDPAVEGIVANVRDVTDRAEAAARLAWQAFHDPLTGLPNRTLLRDRLRQALGRARRSGELTAVLFIDLDRFKLVNDSYGHEAGDHLLIAVAARLEQTIRRADTVARLGGDEFVVLAEALNDEAEAHVLAERILDVLTEPIELPQGPPVTISGSIGIAYDTDHLPETLLREADTALYRAKERGKNRFEVFDESLRVEVVRRLATERLLRDALEGDGLVVHYQPIIDLVSGAVVGAEALLRLRGPGGRLHSPAEFIAVAEESGLIVAVGAGVLDHACAQLARWRTDLGLDAPSRVSVNVSARQLASSGFVEILERVLAAHGLRPGDLVLEFTESTVLEADDLTYRTVERLHELGVVLAIDDFGTGYSSLAYLKRFPIDIVKLDRTFVDGLGSDPSDTEIVKAVVSLGRSLGLVVVAEGIETPEQLEALTALGCDCGQGYLLAVPAPGEELEAQRRTVAEALGH